MISFIIPTKNEGSVIGKTLDSLSKYSGTKEIIVSDGRSTDGTIEIAKQYTDKIAIFKGNGKQNIANGRNEGAKIAQGKFLVFVDADVTIPNIDIFLGRLISEFSKKPKLVAVTVSVRVLPNMENIFDKVIFSLVNAYHMILNNWLHIGGSPGEFQMIRTEAFKQIRGFNEKLFASEDEEMFYRLSRIGRTRFELGLAVYHTGRRAHKIGWPKLLWQWFINYMSMIFLKRSASDEWKEVR